MIITGIHSRMTLEANPTMKATNTTEAELLLQFARSNDVQSFNMLVERLAGFAYRVAYRYCRNQTDAEDIVQSTFIKIMELAPNFQIEKSTNGSIRSWVGSIIFNIAGNRSVKSRRRKRNEEAFSRRLEYEQKRNSSAQGGDRKSKLREAVDSLPEKYRWFMILKYYEGLTLDEVAEATGKGKGVVRGALERGLNSLRQRFSESGMKVGAVALVGMLSDLNQESDPMLVPDSLVSELQELPVKLNSGEISFGDTSGVSGGVYVALSAGLIIGIAGYLYFENPTKQTSPRLPNSSVQIGTGEEDNSPEKTFSWNWNFENGMPEELRGKRGFWKIENDDIGKGKVLKADKNPGTSFMIPSLEGKYFKLEITGNLLDEKPAIMLDRTYDGKPIGGWNVSCQNKINLKINTPFHAEIYGSPERTAIVIEGWNKFAVYEYPVDAKANTFFLNFSSFSLKTISLRQILKEEFPAEYSKDLQSFGKEIKPNLPNRYYLKNFVSPK